MAGGQTKTPRCRPILLSNLENFLHAEFKMCMLVFALFHTDSDCRVFHRCEDLASDEALRATKHLNQSLTRS